MYAHTATHMYNEGGMVKQQKKAVEEWRKSVVVSIPKKREGVQDG